LELRPFRLNHFSPSGSPGGELIGLSWPIKKEWLEVLRPFVAGGGRTLPSQEEAARKLGVPIATLRTWLSRLRQRYREALRMEVARTVSDPADVDQELISSTRS
jgi:hypothetical protein